eukprot:COSAG04_NODE_457_length_14036_cov_27.040109_10_plen_176_part_00
MMYQVPPPVAEAFGHEFLIAAGRSDDDWSVRASGFAPQSYWGMSSYSDSRVATGDAEPGLRYEASSGETPQTIAERLGFANGLGLASLNQPIYGETLQLHALLKRTATVRVTLLVPTPKANDEATVAALARGASASESTPTEPSRSTVPKRNRAQPDRFSETEFIGSRDKNRPRQ